MILLGTNRFSTTTTTLLMLLAVATTTRRNGNGSTTTCTAFLIGNSHHKNSHGFTTTIQTIQHQNQNQNQNQIIHDNMNIVAVDKHSYSYSQSALFSLKEGNDKAAPSPPPPPPPIEPLKPFLPAMDPNYINVGPIGQEDGNESKFILQRSGPPTKDELSNENLYKILMIECSDLEVNTLVWKCLGYRFISESCEGGEVGEGGEQGKWISEEVFPKWREKYPTPPDLIGMQRIYTKEVDQVSLKANQSLVRSVPVDNKQSLKTHLKPLGFTGYKYAELTPNKTRRAQCANWLLYYREELFGFTVEELKERRQKKREAEEAEKLRLEKEAGKKLDDEWKPPVREVF